MITYALDFSQFNQHLVQVTLSFTAKENAPQLWLPSWIPGSYLMREFARNITRVEAKVAKNKTPCAKITKNTWQLNEIKAGDKVKVAYEVYAYDLSVRSAYVDQTRLYGNFTSLALAVRGQEDEKITVQFAIPTDFEKLNKPTNIACTLPTKTLKSGYQFTAQNYDELIDHPFEIAKQDSFTFKAVNRFGNGDTKITHDFVMSGKHHANMKRLKTDLKKICQAYIDWMGDAPFDQYLFMTMATGNDYGGLEHQNSTSLITPRKDLPSKHEADEPSKNYRSFLGLCSHEYFHAWWVKCVRPQVYLQPDLTQEVYTPLLWVFEGFTSYYDDLMLFRSGVVNAKSYMQLLTDQINRYYQTHGRVHQTVAESSFDAWIKLYRADENTANAGISYYNKGALVALCLDLILKKQGKRLDDVVKALYERAKQGERGISDAVLDELIGSLMGEKSWQHFRSNYIDGTQELPFAELLQDNGVSLDAKDKHWAFGLQTSKTDAGLKVNRALREGKGAEAGISAKDIIIAVDGIKATDDLLTQAAKRGERVQVHFFRRDELLEVIVDAENQAIECVTLNVADEAAMLGWLKTVS